MAELLAIAGLHAGYGATEILRGIDLAVNEGEIVAVLGSNGAGKSTLNRAISGVLRPWRGAIRFEQQPIERAKPSAIVARGLIHVPEGRRIFPNMTVGENLDLGCYRRARARRAQNRERVFGIFPRLAERQGQSAGTLSGGEQQMLAIGRGLMAEPKLLILDEPSLGLSPLLVEELFAPDQEHQPRRASRCCWSSRTWCRASRWRAAPMCSTTARLCCREAPPTCATTRT